MADVGVRPAAPTDAASVAAIQVRTWRGAYSEILPTPALEEVTSPEAEQLWAGQWREAAANPPSPRHRLLIAVETGTPVGFAAYGPATEPGRTAEDDAELITLLVDPAYWRRGHGSRLLAATVDNMRDDGFTAVVTWVFEADVVLESFLVSAGWARDGARRELDMGEPIRQVRLHTAIDATEIDSR
ncbi:MAG: GNAT family N-acetyltransferase [Streptosporangiales bacterium]|nr:GNAT family N-acetyltransferase [Streptosporangiales bacterium]